MKGKISSLEKRALTIKILKFIKSPKKKLAPNLGVSGIEDFKIPL